MRWRVPLLAICFEQASLVACEIQSSSLKANLGAVPGQLLVEARIASAMTPAASG